MSIAAIVVNPVKVDEPALRAALSAAEERWGWEPTLWLETTEEDPGAGQTREALERGVDVVIAAGGDGTVRTVAEALRGHGTPLALLPSGTGNLLARNLGLTLDDVENALDSAFGGDDRPIDVGVAELRDAAGKRSEHAYLVMAGFGIDAQMIAATDDDLKAKAGWLAYVKAIGTVLRDKNELRLRYSLDGGRVHSVRAHTVIVGNCGSLPANILLLPDAAVDDGQFDIVVLRPEGFFGWVQIVAKVFWENGVLRRTSAGRRLMGSGHEIQAMNYLKGKELVLRLDRPEPVDLDGDLFGEVTAMRTRIDPLSLVVRVPSDREPAAR
ncbi:diacylglycerol/lipid kinase family protein [Leifsonia aquatica]|jgi:diacylglycerol kinase family enzyme|uniref:Diacylglycerol kinase catalytic domain protein n=2 Tax=Leifsonia aquatica TaxID=144185 RepID=U2RMD2_LEIAQ|nr:diacylglycerol kinase family protein [Leifsonia aquatica]ERK69734.1 diacylglycerol kinase catalytic domain protein [Leifsonia aquatica ATCC 14665]MBB2968650.1 diacylglycerol kinase family enzyme [Leifsonia aquatica]